MSNFGQFSTIEVVEGKNDEKNEKSGGMLLNIPVVSTVSISLFLYVSLTVSYIARDSYFHAMACARTREGLVIEELLDIVKIR